MYDDDEEDLALLQQYEKEGANSSDDDLDSDLEDKIMSAVQYETDTTRNWPDTSQRGQLQQGSNSTNGELANRSTIPPIAMTHSTSDAVQPDYSSDDDSSISSFNGHDDNNENNDSLANDGRSNYDAPPIIRHIDLNITDKELQQDDSTDEEEGVLNHELQQLIDEQIRNRANRQRPPRRSRKQLPFCFSCLSPGHIQRDCSLCNDCGGERHPNSSCPSVFYCFKCKERGHYAMDCQNKKCYDSCRHCGDDYHASQWCPKLVHVYKNQVPPTKTVGRFCYNCGKKGHYGDECPMLPESFQSQQSVFSFNSLSVSPNHSLRTASQPSKRSRHDTGRRPQHHRPIHQRFSDHSDSEDDERRKKNNRSTKRKEEHRQREFDGKAEKKKKKKRGSSKGKRGNEQQDTERLSGNSNWKALTKASPSLSSSRPELGYMKIEHDFPRNLPKPSFSGVINSEPAPRRPKYNGGYNRE